MYINSIYSKSDIMCPCGCEAIVVNQELIYRLTMAGYHSTIKIRPVSWVRCLEHNKTHKGPFNLGHYDGEAVDILAVTDTVRFEIVQALIMSGFKRIVLYKKHIHTDITQSKTIPYLSYKGA